MCLRHILLLIIFYSNNSLSLDRFPPLLNAHYIIYNFHSFLHSMKIRKVINFKAIPSLCNLMLYLLCFRNYLVILEIFERQLYITTNRVALSGQLMSSLKIEAMQFALWRNIMECHLMVRLNVRKRWYFSVNFYIYD